MPIASRRAPPTTATPTAPYIIGTIAPWGSSLVFAEELQLDEFVEGAAEENSGEIGDETDDEIKGGIGVHGISGSIVLRFAGMIELLLEAYRF
jgi:hypothetical protein